MASELAIQTRIVDDDILAVILHGNLNAATTEEFNEAVQSHLDEGRTKVIIDCCGVDYISSFGIGTLMAPQARLRKKGGQVKLSSVFGVAAETIRLLRLEKVLDIYGDLEFARQSFDQPGG